MQANEKTRAIKIQSHVLGEDIWLIFDPTFVPDDQLVRYSIDEIPLLVNLAANEIRSVHDVKKEMIGAKVVEQSFRKVLGRGSEKSASKKRRTK